MKVVYNDCYGGFGLSKDALCLYNKKRVAAGLSLCEWSGGIKDRHDPILVDVVEEMGKEANGDFADLKIEEISDDYIECYEIKEYDGLEHVVCDAARLVQHLLTGVNTQSLNDQECRALLEKMVLLLNPISNKKHFHAAS